METHVGWAMLLRSLEKARRFPQADGAHQVLLSADSG